MTEETHVETTQDDPQEPQVAQPRFASASQNEVEPSQTAEDFDAVIDRLIDSPKFEEKLAKKFQSVKDKRIGRMEKDLGEVKDTLATVDLDRYKALLDKGLDHEDAKWRIQMENAVMQRETPVNEKPQTAFNPKPQGKVEDWTVRQRDILDIAGITENDPAFIQFASRDWDNPDQYLGELKKWVKTKQPPDTPATLVQPSGSGGSGKGKSVDELAAELAELQKEPSKHKERRKELRKQIQELSG
jgi:hypothetical protein